MRGSMILFAPGKGSEVREFDRVPTLEELQKVVGGDLEAIQGFRSIEYGSVVMDCVALCNEHGKFDHLPINTAATLAWERALRRIGISLRDFGGVPRDWLAGPVIVLFGDREFMQAL